MRINRYLQLYNFSRRAYSSLSNECITVSRRKDKAVIQFNRPEKRNALTIEMQCTLNTLLRDFENDTGVSAVIIKGNEAGFCAGGDVVQFTQIIKSDKKFFFDCGIGFYRGLLRLAEYKKPVIVLADKLCIGQGAAVTFLSSHPIVTERTLFTMPEVFVGLYNVGSSYRLARLPNNFGMWIGLTGTRFIGSDIVNLGLSKNYVNSTDLDRLEDELINLKKTDFETVSQTIAQFQQKSDKWSIEPEKVKQLFNGSSVEEIVENLKEDRTEFSSKILKTLSNVSPTALKLAFHIIREFQLKQYSKNEALSADFSLYKNFYGDTDSNDFSEGVRSAIIDKTHKPNWIPKTLEEVDDKKVISYFTTNVIDIRASSP
ncbi:3-hydroxyisobutyryl-CoA hydrolase, mitochondrial-like [Bradysia coprophila]|uniref:3-hydroxyisobutyryl-CoA hydrolase, mitochondrial-like n=1 Tax=Bradysia coprophila TaxID=38358 RepID=UPI00187D718E|nr:3-hydroxyisobutyryl-CoA hydrolase, mitochondrial-like [Bradysia coprophila]